MVRKILCLEITILTLLLLGCSRDVKNTEIVFDNNKLHLDGSNRVKVSGKLIDGETGDLEANVNREKITINVDSDGEFSFYYKVKNLQDNQIYLGIKSNGTIIGDEIEVSISKNKRNDSLINVQNIIDEYLNNGLTVANIEKLENQDYMELGLRKYPYSGVKFSTVYDNTIPKNVRIFAFSNDSELDQAFNILKLQAIKDEGYDNSKENSNEITPFIQVNPIVNSKYEFYLNNSQKFPLLRSWIYKTYIEDVGYLLIQQDANINSVVAGKHEELAKNTLNNNQLDNT